MFNRCIICGSGNSIQEGLDKEIQSLLKNEIVFTLNEEFRFFDSTITFFGDWTFYKCRYDLLKNHPFVIGRFDSAIGKSVNYLSQLMLLPSCPNYVGIEESWKKGFYTGVLTGLFTLTIAISLGFKEIFLLGFDSKMINGKTHHYEGLEGFGHFVNNENKPRTGMGIKNNLYNTKVFNKNDKDYNALWNVYLNELKNIKIYNVSIESKIDTFPKIPYDEFISIIKNYPSNIHQNKTRQELKKYIKYNARFDKNNSYNIN